MSANESQKGKEPAKNDDQQIKQPAKDNDQQSGQAPRNDEEFKRTYTWFRPCTPDWSTGPAPAHLKMHGQELGSMEAVRTARHDAETSIAKSTVERAAPWKCCQCNAIQHAHVRTCINSPAHFFRTPHVPCDGCTPNMEETAPGTPHPESDYF